MLATIASLLALPSLASAAPKGSKLTVEVKPLTPAVSPNMDGAFDVVVTNGGNATLTHATLTVTADGVTVRPESCDATLVCDLGTLVSKDVRSLRFVVGDVTEAVSITARLQVDAGTGNPSQDAKPGEGTITVDNTGLLFAGWQGAGDPVDTDEHASITNSHQSAEITVPAVGFDYAARLAMADERVCGERGIGQAVEMHFADGQEVSDFLTVTVKYDAATRGNRTPGNVGFVHDPDIGGCTPMVKGCLTAGCYNAWWEGTGQDKLLVVEARLASNGLGKGL
ncbi:MAG TPA: hypothetical protein VJ975_00110 [Candidatus Limnocylindria bacterium]|nr:hypothetical protein [Candidatus Limnocylindria bacterium]